MVSDLIWEISERDREIARLKRDNDRLLDEGAELSANVCDFLFLGDGGHSTCEARIRLVELEKLHEDVLGCEHPAGGDEPVQCSRCGLIKPFRHTFSIDIGKDERMCWLCGGKAIRGLRRVVQVIDSLEKALEERKRERLRGTLGALMASAVPRGAELLNELIDGKDEG